MSALLGRLFCFMERFKNKCRRAYTLRRLRRHGENVHIGAGSVVTHNVEPYAVVAGNPAKILRFRERKEDK